MDLPQETMTTPELSQLPIPRGSCWTLTIHPNPYMTRVPRVSRQLPRHQSIRHLHRARQGEHRSRGSYNEHRVIAGRYHVDLC